MSNYEFENLWDVHTREAVLAGSQLSLGSFEALVVRKHGFGNYPASLITVHEQRSLYWMAHETLDFRVIRVALNHFAHWSAG